jgi:hypothetical protein
VRKISSLRLEIKKIWTDSLTRIISIAFGKRKESNIQKLALEMAKILKRKLINFSGKFGLKSITKSQ